jgi:DNA-binding beta-propeller fold protein YncE
MTLRARSGWLPRFLATAAAVLLAPALTAADVSAQERIYVANQGEATVAVLDADGLEIVETVDLQALGFSANAKPHHIAVEPDGSHWYLSLIGENRVLKFDRDNDVVGAAEFEVPGMLALDPASDMLYVGRSMSAVNPPMRIGAIERGAMTLEEIDVLYPRPHALVVHPSGGQVYSASLGENRMAAIDADSWDVELVDVPGETHALVQFAVSPDGSTLVATGELTGELLVFDLTADPAAPRFVRAIEVGSRPWHPVFGTDNRHVYFGTKGDDAIVEVDVEAGAVTRTFTAPGVAMPHGSALGADGTTLYITSNGPGGMSMSMGSDHGDAGHGAGGHDEGHHGDGHGEGGPETGTVTVVDLAAGTVVKVVPVGRNATGIGTAGPR